MNVWGNPAASSRDCSVVTWPGAMNLSRSPITIEHRTRRSALPSPRSSSGATDAPQQMRCRAGTRPLATQRDAAAPPCENPSTVTGTSAARRAANYSYASCSQAKVSSISRRRSSRVIQEAPTRAS